MLNILKVLRRVELDYSFQFWNMRSFYGWLWFLLLYKVITSLAFKQKSYLLMVIFAKPMANVKPVTQAYFMARARPKCNGFCPKWSLQQRFQFWAHKLESITNAKWFACAPIMALEPKCNGVCHQIKSNAKAQQQMGPQGHKPIKRIMQFFGFYWEQSLIQKSQNHTDGSIKPISPSKG